MYQLCSYLCNEELSNVEMESPISFFTKGKNVQVVKNATESGLLKKNCASRRQRKESSNTFFTIVRKLSLQIQFLGKCRVELMYQFTN